MLLIPCPYCGSRSELEFSYGGEAHLTRPTASSQPSEAEWAAFQYERSNVKGPPSERWRHSRGCGRFFNMVRDTTTDQILRCYRVGET